MTDVLTRRPARHLSVVPPIVEFERHPSWCHGKSLCGDAHTGEWASVPATGGEFSVDDECAAFPLVELSPALRNGAPFVSITLKSPLVDDLPRTRNWIGVDLSPDAATILIGALFNAVCGTPAREDAYGDTYWGRASVGVAADADVIRLALARECDGAVLSALLRPVEARRLADAIGTAVDLATAPVEWVDVEVRTVAR